jgi:hypothetical protein
MSQETVLMSERDTKRMNGFNTIRNLVESYYNLDLSSKSRTRPNVEARAIYYTLIKSKIKSSLYDIGRGVNRNHATVIHGLKLCEMLMETDEKFRNDYNLLKDRLDLMIESDLNQIDLSDSKNTEGHFEKMYQIQKRRADLLEQDLIEVSGGSQNYVAFLRDYRSMKHKFNYLISKLDGKYSHLIEETNKINEIWLKGDTK